MFYRFLFSSYAVSSELHVGTISIFIKGRLTKPFRIV